MRRNLRAYLVASGLITLSALPFFDAPAQAQVGVDISFDAFHDQLSNYGDWLYSDRWGEVWRPIQQDQDPNWRPYTVGHWVYTDEYGWTWASDETGWGDVVYHYGRWVYDPDAGWLWMAGYVWSPAWVVWRSAGPNVGWMPMPPDQSFLGFGNPGIAVNVSFGNWDDINGYYGYSNWYGPSFNAAQFSAFWVFVPTGHVADPGYRSYAVAQPQVVNFVRNSRNVTNYTVVNNVIINRSVNITVVQQAAGHPIAPVHASTVFHNTRWIAPVNKGVQVQTQMRLAVPRGNGTANSAPRPTPAQVQTLSTRAVPIKNAGNGAAPAHVFTRATVAKAQSHPNGNGAGAAVAPRQPNPPSSPARPNTPPGAARVPPRAMNRPAEPAAPTLEQRREERPPVNAAPNVPIRPEQRTQIPAAPIPRAPQPTPQRQPEQTSPQERRDAQPPKPPRPEPAPPAPLAPPPQANRVTRPPKPARIEAARVPAPPHPAAAAKPNPAGKAEPDKRDDKRPEQ